jgi:hypothetical protein
MLKAELGDFLYYIIVVIVILASIIEKASKAKKKRQAELPADMPELAEEAYNEAQPQSLEDVMRRMFEQQVETQQVETATVAVPKKKKKKAESQNYRKDYYQPVVYQPITVATTEMDDTHNVADYPSFEFDLRQAIISNEILNKKYS